MKGAAKNMSRYKNRESARLKKNTEEKSRSSASFFWISAVPRPLSTKTWRMVVKTVTSARTPYTSGPRMRARTRDTTKVTPWAPKRSAKRQIKLLAILPEFINTPACGFTRLKERWAEIV